MFNVEISLGGNNIENIYQTKIYLGKVKMNNQENITKLSEIRDSVKKMILEYNTISHSIKLETRLALMTHSGQDLLTDKQIDHLYFGRQCSIQLEFRRSNTYRRYS